LLRNLALWTRRLAVNRSGKATNHRMGGTSASCRHDAFVERLRDDDIGELLTLQRAAFVSDAQRYEAPFLPSLTQTLEQLRDEASDPDRHFLVAKRGTRLVGAVRTVRTGRIIHISRLMTAPDLEGRGIGSLLLNAIEAATSKNADEFELTTGAKSTVNIGMYRRRGYRVTRESIDTAGINVVHMRKPVGLAAIPAPSDEFVKSQT
jgi:ribosomal protein S18 acetylase RimI-like enzyme